MAVKEILFLFYQQPQKVMLFNKIKPPKWRLFVVWYLHYFFCKKKIINFAGDEIINKHKF